MLKVKNLKVSYGNIVAVKDVSFEVGSGQLVCLIGPNGAGKTTILRAISGVEPVLEGKIEFEGSDLTNNPPYEIARSGLISVPEGRKILPYLSVKDNLEVGAFLEKNKERKKNNYEKVLSMFPELKAKLNQMGGTLSGGQQQMLAIGRALMANPKLMLMDEPSMGLAPKLVSEIFDGITKMKSEGKTILLVEQNAHAALRLADYAYVLERGQIGLSDVGEKLLNNKEVILSYLGGRRKE